MAITELAPPCLETFAEPVSLQVARAVISNGMYRYLLVQRAETLSNNPGYWEFTGGKVDPGETPLEGIKREAKEEIGYPIHVVQRPFYTYEYEIADGKHKGKLLTTFVFRGWLSHENFDLTRGRGRIPGVRPDPTEVADYAWLSAPEISQEPNLTDSCRKTVKYLLGRNLM